MHQEYWLLKKEYDALVIKHEELKKSIEQQSGLDWSIEDIFAYAADNDYSITYAQADIAFTDMLQNADASQGFSWDTIEHYVIKHGSKNEEG